MRHIGTILFSVVALVALGILAPNATPDRATAATPPGSTSFANVTYAAPDSLPRSVSGGFTTVPDGSHWFVQYSENEAEIAVERIDPTGKRSQFPVPLGALGSGTGYAVAHGLALGQDGDLWFLIDLHGDALPGVGRVTLGADPSVTVFPLPLAYYSDLATSPQGGIWTTQWADTDSAAAIVRVADDGSTTAYPSPSGRRDGLMSPITSTDGSVWYADYEAGTVGHVAPDGSISEYAIHGAPEALFRDDKGALWYATVDGAAGTVSTDGTVTAILPANPINDGLRPRIVQGPSGEIWVIQPEDVYAATKMVLISPSGIITRTATPGSWQVDGATHTADGALWIIASVNCASTCSAANFDRRVERVDPTGTVKVVGSTSGQYGYGTIASNSLGDTIWVDEWIDDARLGPIERLDSFTASGRETTHALSQRTDGSINSIQAESDGQVWALAWGTGTIARLTPVSTSRVYGSDRYATAVAVSRAAFPTGAPVVFVASGATYADALAAGPAAVMSNGPLLLTASGSLPAPVKAEIARLKPRKIVVVGGTGAVSAAVAATLKKIQHNTVRLAGADRYATARAIAGYSLGTGHASHVYIATGADYPDALSIGAAAGATASPVLLVPGTARHLDSATTALLRRLGVKNITILGGPSVVSSGIQKDAAKLALTVRLAGSDRYETSQLANSKALSTFPFAILASGSSFADALAGAGWAGAERAPVFLTPSNCVPASVLTRLVSAHTTQVAVLGGPTVENVAVQKLTPCGTR